MQSVTVRQPCSAPVDLVWRIAIDLEHASDAIPGIMRTELLTDGPFGVGTRWRETRKMYGKEASEEMTITAVEPGRSYTAEAESNGMHYTTTWQFLPSDGGTEIVMTFGGEATNMLMTVLSKLTGWMSGSVGKMMQRDMADLAATAEARAAE